MTIEKLEKQGYKGVDVDLTTSLFEYGLIWAKNEHCTSETEYHVYYKCGELFGSGYVVLADFIEELQDGWIKDFNGSYCGMTKAQVIKDIRQGNMNTFYSLYQYYGAENCIGTDYDPIKIEE